MFKKITLSLCIALIAFGASNVKAADEIDEAIIKGKQMIEKAVNDNDEAALLKARAHFERLAQQEEMQWLTQYYIGYADYRLASYYMVRGNREQQIKYLEDAMEHLNIAIENKDDFADAYGLLSSVMGQRINTEPALGMKLGIESSQLMSDALDFGEMNPRVAMFYATSAYYTPEQFGGSKTRAMEEIQRAITLFKEENLDDSRMPDWGHADAHAFAASWYLAADKIELAAKHADEALAINPQHGFAKMLKGRIADSK